MSTRIVIIVTVGGLPEVLMDGVITRQELAPSSEPGQSTLTVTGEDLSALMDLIDLTGLGLLTFHDGDSFTGEAGEIIATSWRRGMLVQADLDGDGDTDFSVMINGAASMRATDFVLLTLE